MVIVFFMPNFLGHPDNYIEANPLATPAHIVPEWYFLPYYAILRAVPSKLGGVVLMFGSIFVLFLLPGIVYGVSADTVRSSKDVIDGMTKAMQTMAYYLVIMFFIAQFLYAFSQSNLGVLLALKGAAVLQNLGLPAALTIAGVVILTGLLNLFVGSASAKWALLAPILVPMLMGLGISPDLTQAAYRVGDSTTNIITPLMPYFPLVVVYCQRYIKDTGIGIPPENLQDVFLPFHQVAHTQIRLEGTGLGLGKPDMFLTCLRRLYTISP